MRVYVASSWRNALQPSVVERLRAEGHEVYDFRHPAPGNEGFHWSAIDPKWKEWTPDQYRRALDHTIAEAGFAFDMEALSACEACVLVLPCGRSAHLEAGLACGEGKQTYFLMTEPSEPELMYKMGSGVVTSLDELVAALAE